MSRTQPVILGSRTFWAYDAALAVWLAAVIDAASAGGLGNDLRWRERLESWRGVASSDVALRLDMDAEEHAMFLQIAAAATESLRARGPLDGSQVGRLRLLDDCPTNAQRYAREKTVDVEPIMRLGEAIMDLVTGRLPPPEPGTWWLFGSSREPEFIRMRSDAPPG